MEFNRSNKILPFFFLEQGFIQQRSLGSALITFYEWQIIAGLICNSIISDKIIEFIKELDLIKISSIKDMALGSYFSLEKIYDFDKRLFDKSGLRNLLYILNIDSVLTESLLNEAFKNKNLDNIYNFLLTFEAKINGRFVLTEALALYKIINSGKDLKKERKEVARIINNIMQTQFAELEDFDVFDMFESSEQSKSRSSLIIYYSFYNNLFDDFVKREKSEIRELFCLFEEFLISLENQILEILIKDLPKFFDQFRLAKKAEILQIFEKNKQFFNSYLRVVDFKTFLLQIAVAGFVILQRRTIVATFKLNRPSSAPFAMIAHNNHLYSSKTRTALVDSSEMSQKYLSKLDLNSKTWTPKF